MIDDTTKEFINRHIGPSNKDQKKMLEYIGSSSLEKLIKDTVPENILLKEDLKIDNSLSESEALKKLKLISQKNKTFRNVKGQASSLKNVKNLKNITSTPLKPISQATKNSIIMAESAFSITVLDNKAEAMKRGLSDNQATVYSGVVSLAEGLVQSIMPDANFFKVRAIPTALAIP